MKKILVIEDSPRSQELIRQALQDHYHLFFKDSPVGVSEMLARQKVDLLLLDVHMEGEDGIQFYSRISRQLKEQKIPVIFLTAREDISAKISAFKLGASDYLVKPYESAELLLRIEARLRDTEQGETTRITNDFYLDHKQCALFFIQKDSHVKIELSPTEYKLASLFSHHPDQLFSRNQIFDHVWGINTHFLDRTVDRHISSLKKKASIFKSHLKAVYGMGYIFQLNSNDEKKSRGC